MPNVSVRQSPQHKPPSLARSNITACIRCRRRKKRCDQKLPACGLCEAAGVECVGYDAVAQRNIPRSYVYDLERQIARLKSKLRQYGEAGADDDDDVAQVSTATPGTLGIGQAETLQSPENLEDAAPPPRSIIGQASEAHETLEDILKMSRCSYSHEPTFSKTLLAGLMDFERANSLRYSWEKQNARDKDPILSLVSEELGLSPCPLPERKTAEYFIKSYFAFANFSLPLLHEPTFRQQLELAYASTSEPQSHLEAEQDQYDIKIATFFANIVFALGLLILQKHDPSKFPTLVCDRYYHTALKALEEGIFPKNVEGVQALLLLAQYSYMHPVNFGGWNMIGLALRRAVELGLHEDPPVDAVDPVTLDTMRRTFWVAYCLDRNVAIATGRPTCLSDSAITAKYPSHVDDEYITTDSVTIAASAPSTQKTYSFHWFRYRQLQSEMIDVLRGKASTVFPAIDYTQWQATMHSRIQQWYDEVSQETQACDDDTGNIVVPSRFELTYQRALVFLYRPSPRIPSLSMEALLQLASSAAKVITLYRQFYHETKIHLFWQAVESIFDAGTALIYSYINGLSVQELFSMRELEGLIHSSSNLLWGLVERFPSFKGKRDAFDVIASKTLSDIRSQSDTLAAAEFLSPGQYDGHLATTNGIEDQLNEFQGFLGSIVTFSVQPTNNRGLELPPADQVTSVGLPDFTDIDQTRQGRNIPGNPVLVAPDVISQADLDESSIDWETLNETGQLASMAWD